MPEITNIERQKLRNQRINLFVDDEFVCGLSDNILAKYKLFVGKELKQRTLEKIVEEALVEKYYDRVLGLLARRPRSEFEIKIKLKEYFYKAKIEEKDIYTEKIIKKLQKAGYINDYDFGIWLVNSRIGQKKKSWREIAYELSGKRISRETIKKIEEKYKEGVDSYERKVIKIIAVKKRRSYAGKSSSRKIINQKVMAYLYNKGFKAENINEVMADKTQN